MLGKHLPDKTLNKNDNMKTKILLLLILSFATIKGFSQGRKEKEFDQSAQPGKQEQIEMLINSREFVFRARRAIPSGGRSIDLTSNTNFVKFEPDLIESYMPFFGRAYSSAGYGDQGLHFKGKPQEFYLERKKRNYQITATVNGESDIYRLFLTVAPGGNASLSITSNNRQSMSYNGTISANEKIESKRK